MRMQLIDHQIRLQLPSWWPRSLRPEALNQMDHPTPFLVCDLETARERYTHLTLALGATLFLFVTLGLGVLISTVSQNQGQAIQLAFMTVLPQILLSGLLFPLHSMAAGVRWIGYLLPLTYFIQLSRGVMVRGTPIDALVLPLTMLAVLGVAVFGLSLIRFRRDLAPGGRARTEAAEESTTVPAGAR